MVLNATQAWVARSELEFFLGEERRHTRSDTDLVTLTRFGSANGRLHCAVLKFLVYISPFTHLKDNAHIYNYKKHKLNHGSSIHL